jgi:hypothetical protein
VSNSLRIEDDPEYLRHPRVHALADMLDVPGLKILAANHMETTLATKWTTTEFPKIICEVFSTTNSQDKTARNVLIKATRNHLTELSENDDFKAVLSEHGEFSGGLVMDFFKRSCNADGCACAARPSPPYCSSCTHYHHSISN